MNNRATIALYGIRQTGFGWIAQIQGGAQIGTGDPEAAVVSMTEAIWIAYGALRGAGLADDATIHILQPGGERSVMWNPRRDGLILAGNLKWK